MSSTCLDYHVWPDFGINQGTIRAWTQQSSFLCSAKATDCGYKCTWLICRQRNFTRVVLARQSHFWEQDACTWCIKKSACMCCAQRVGGQSSPQYYATAGLYLRLNSKFNLNTVEETDRLRCFKISMLNCVEHAHTHTEREMYCHYNSSVNCLLWMRGWLDVSTLVMRKLSRFAKLDFWARVIHEQSSAVPHLESWKWAAYRRSLRYYHMTSLFYD